MIASYTASAVALSPAADPVDDGLGVPSGVRILVDISPLPCMDKCGVLPATGGPLPAMLLAAGFLLLLTGCAMIGHWWRTDRRAQIAGGAAVQVDGRTATTERGPRGDRG
jgi:hypothetical protein